MSCNFFCSYILLKLNLRMIRIIKSVTQELSSQDVINSYGGSLSTQPGSQIVKNNSVICYMYSKEIVS